MSEAVSSSKPRHLLFPGRHGPLKHGAKQAAGGDTDDELGELEQRRRRRRRRRQHKTVDKSSSYEASAQEINNSNVKHLSAHQEADRNELSNSKRASEHANHKRHHHHHHHHPHPSHHRSRAYHSHQVAEVRSSVHVSSSRRLKFHLNHMQHKTDPSLAANDHQESRLTGITLPSAIYSGASQPKSSGVKSASNHLSGLLVDTTSRSPIGARLPPHTRAIGSFGGAEPKLLNYIMLISLPLCACLMFGLLFLLLLQYCKNLKRACGKAKQKSSAMKKNSNKMKKFMSSPIGFISNGKMFNYSSESDLHGVTIMRGKEATVATTLKDDYGKALDCRQLTINMEGSTDLSAEDSDEQQQQQQQQPPPNELKAINPGKPKSKNNKLVKPGMLKYSLEYDFNQSILSISIMEARELPGMDLNGLSDPYVCVFMSNNKSYQMFKTKIHKHTLNPVFNETFEYKISYAELIKQTLILSVYDYDRLSKHDEIGQLVLPMNSIDLAQRQVNWSELRRMNETSDGRLGDICLSLRYVPTAGRLNVVILEARQLKKMDVAGLSDPYVKLSLISNGRRLKKKKTSIKKCTLNPHYNESFSFEIPFEQAQEVQLVITVVDYDRIGTSEPIGQVTLGCVEATGETELRHWMDMLASPRRPIARWHSLKAIENETKPNKLQARRFSQLITNKSRD